MASLLGKGFLVPLFMGLFVLFFVLPMIILCTDHTKMAQKEFTCWASPVSHISSGCSIVATRNQDQSAQNTFGSCPMPGFNHTKPETQHRLCWISMNSEDDVLWETLRFDFPKPSEADEKAYFDLVIIIMVGGVLPFLIILFIVVGWKCGVCRRVETRVARIDAQSMAV